MDSTQADAKKVWIVPGGDHSDAVLTDDQNMADRATERMAAVLRRRCR